MGHVMDTEVAKARRESAEIRALAEKLDCITDAQLQQLAGVKEGTTLAWRKRRIGPPHVRPGRAVLYPRLGVIEFLQGRVRSVVGLTANAL
jgi:hypothetical protein